MITYLFSFFQFVDRTPISRVRDCCGLAESEISGGIQVFGMRQRFDHFEHGGPVQTAGTVREESPPIKAGDWRAIPHLETTVHVRDSTSTRRRTCSSAGPGRSQQLQILPSLNSKAFYSGSAYFSCCANISMDANISPGEQILASA